MPARPYFVLQEFEQHQGRWYPKPAREVASRDIATRAVARLRAANKPGLAFAREWDPDSGDTSDPEIIASFDVPPEFMGESTDV